MAGSSARDARRPPRRLPGLRSGPSTGTRDRHATARRDPSPDTRNRGARAPSPTSAAPGPTDGDGPSGSRRSRWPRRSDRCARWGGDLRRAEGEVWVASETRHPVGPKHASARMTPGRAEPPFSAMPRRRTVRRSRTSPGGAGSRSSRRSSGGSPDRSGHRRGGGRACANATLTGSSARRIDSERGERGGSVLPDHAEPGTVPSGEGRGDAATRAGVRDAREGARPARTRSSARKLVLNQGPTRRPATIM